MVSGDIIDPVDIDGGNGSMHMRTTSTGNTWTYPSPIPFIGIALLLTFQCSLLFLHATNPTGSTLRLSSAGSTTGPGSRIPSTSPRTLDLLRLAILPPIIWLIWRAFNPESASFKPVKAFVHINTVIQLTKFWTCIRAVEFAISDPREYEWIGYEKAYDNQESKAKEVPAEKTTNPGKVHPPTTSGNITTSDGGKDSRNILLLGWLCLSSLRGIGWKWGIQGNQIPPRHPETKFLSSLLLRIIWSHILMILAVATVVNHRQQSTQHSHFLHSLLSSINIQLSESTNFPTYKIASRFLQVGIFGLVVYTALECGYTALTLATYIGTAILRSIIPLNASWLLTSFRPDPFRSEAWPRLSRKPILATSLADFWGKRWHALFRRIFVAVGSKSLTALPESMGFKINKAIKHGLGVLGAFAMSGILHECFKDASRWQARDPYYRVFIFFTLQAFGLMLERVLLGSIPQGRLRDTIGRIWTWSFLLCTGLLMAECWVDRGIVDNQPPLEEWTWWRWSIPLAFVFPDLSTIRLHQLSHLSNATIATTETMI